MAADKEQYDSTDAICNLHARLTTTFQTGKTKNIAWRKWQLKQLWWMIEDNEEALISSINKDLNRPQVESFITDLAGIRKDLLNHLQHVEEWAADEDVPGDGFISKQLGLARVRKEPLGVVLIIGAWNFPLLLVLQPLIAAISAGCCAILKPSELTPTCQGLLKDLVASYLDTSAIGLVSGGIHETTKLLELRFNHIFFTGSANVGRIISVAAAKYLTPTTLELGGRCPAIVCRSANINHAAKSIAFAKFLNVGQICLSVNHAFVDAAVHDEFVERLKHWNEEFLGGEPASDTAIVNQTHYNRLANLLQNTKGNIICGGDGIPNTLRMKPTVVVGVEMDDILLKDEIFGPILPVVKCDFRNAYQASNQNEHPLAIYMFSKDKQEIEEVLNNTNSGGVTINDVILHAGYPNAPFGGVGGSGHGYYHGAYGFKAFTHLRTVMNTPSWFERLLAFRYPPYKTADIPKGLKLKAGFKRGEGIDDQRQHKPTLKLRATRATAIIAVAGVTYYYLSRFVWK